jgi:hypothetical protein
MSDRKRADSPIPNRTKPRKSLPIKITKKGAEELAASPVVRPWESMKSLPTKFGKMGSLSDASCSSTPPSVGDLFGKAFRKKTVGDSSGKYSSLHE